MGKQFVSFRYMKDLQQAINHVKYVAFREREGDKGYGLFNERSDHAEVNDFLHSINDRRTSHPAAAKIHTLIFTMSGQEWQRGKYMDGDWQTMVRNVMKDWQLKNNFTVDWCASVHFEKGHPHAHVVIKSVQRDANGIERRLNVKMDENREWFKEAMKEEKQRMVHLRGGREPLTREQWLIERRRALQKPQMARSVLININNKIQQRLKEIEMKRQLERDIDR